MFYLYKSGNYYDSNCNLLNDFTEKKLTFSFENRFFEVKRFCNEFGLNLEDMNLIDIESEIEFLKEIYPVIIDLMNIYKVKTFNDLYKMNRMKLSEVLYELIFTKEELQKFMGNLDKTEEYFGGGLVLEPMIGYYEDSVIELDFRSMYPGIIIHYNLHPLNMNTKKIKNEFIEDMLKNDHNNMLIKNNEFEDNNLVKWMKMIWSKKNDSKEKGLNIAEKIYKFIMNCFYGCIGRNDMKYYNVFFVSTITFLGRYNLSKLIKNVESNFIDYKIIYGDTDSLFIFDENINIFELETFLLKYTNGTFLQIKIDNIYDRFVINEKKNYICRIKCNKIIKGKGKFKLSNKNTSKIVMDSIYKCANDYFNNSYENIIELVSKYQQLIEDHNVLEDFSIHRKISNLTDNNSAMSRFIKNFDHNENQILYLRGNINFPYFKGFNDLQKKELIEQLDFDFYLRGTYQFTTLLESLFAFSTLED